MNNIINLRNLILICIASLMGSCNHKDVITSSETTLSFNADGKFKIVQFTDIHWLNGSDNADSTLEILGAVLDTEKPDLVVYTGDIAYSSPQRNAWRRPVSVAIEREIPWTVVLGNHDDEFDMNRDEIFPFLDSLPFFMGHTGPEEVHGYGNYVLSVKDHEKKQTKANLYFFDSNAYTGDPELGYYDWIKTDQVGWYKTQSEALSIEQEGKTIPALAFFHIPLIEYLDLWNSGKTIGRKEEGVASPVVNSGLFAAFLERGEVMGVFTGHDHDNDYIGEWKGIALAFGRVSGLDAYGSFERGGRVIELRENDFGFTSWIRSASGTEMVYHYPNHDLYPDESTTFLKSLNVEPSERGVKYSYYEGKWQSVLEMPLDDTPVSSGKLSNFSLQPAVSDDNFGFSFESLLRIDKKGIYRFTLTSDDGAVLYLNGQEVVNNDGSV